jgi:hypothetical protein
VELRPGKIWIGVISIWLTACAGNATPAFSAPPENYLLTIDQLQSPGFLIQSAPRSLKAAQLSVVTGQNPAVMRANGFLAGGTVEYFRDAGTLSVSNGPVDVVASAEEFATAGQASNQLRSDVAARESNPKVTPISTGQLGDQAHADTQLAVAPDVDQTTVIQITLEWRMDNLLNILVVRGRYGGARLSDALALARAQIGNAVAGGAPRITPSPTPKPVKTSPTASVKP